MGFHFWDEVLKFVEVLTKWPPVILAIAFLFRNRLSSLKLKGKDLEVQLELRQAIVKLRRFVTEADPEIVKQVAPKLLTALLADLPEEPLSKESRKRDRGKGRREDKTDEEATEDDGSDVDDDPGHDEEQ